MRARRLDPSARHEPKPQKNAAHQQEVVGRIKVRHAGRHAWHRTADLVVGNVEESQLGVEDGWQASQAAL